MSIKATGQITISAIADLTYEDICTHDTTTGLIECTHAQDQGCVRVTELQGKSEQVQSTLGKNLFDIAKYGNVKMQTSWTIDGITATFNSDNSLTCSGKYTGSQPNYCFTYFTENLLSILKVGETYFVSPACKIMHKDGTIEYKNTFTVTDTMETIIIYYQLPVSATLPRTYYPMICLSTQSTTYEPFIPNSPSPDYPSVINSVGDSGKLNVVSSNGRRNLFENSSEFMLKPTWLGTAKGTAAEVDEPMSPYGKAVKITVTGAGTGFYHMGGLMPIDKMTVGKIYTWSLFLKSDSITSINTIGHESGGMTTLSISSVWKKYSFTYKMTASSLNAFVIYPNFAIGDTLYIHSFKLEECGEYSDWSPAVEDITPENYKQYEDKLSLASVNLISPLRSLPNGVHDVLECKDGIWGVTRNISTNPITFPPTGGHSEYAKVGNGSVRRSWVNNSFICEDPNEICVLSEKYTADTWNNMHLSSGGLFIEKPFAICGWDYSGNSRFDIMVPESVLTTKDAAGLTAYLTVNSPVFYAQLKAPTWEPLDDPSQKSLNNLLSYSGKDYIYTTEPLATNFSVAVKSRAFYENFKLQEEIKNTNTSLGDLDDEIKGGFYDGIINVNEAEAIRKAAETMHTQVTNQFNKVDSNTSLTGTPKTTHQTKYTECNNAYNTLISKINTAIDYCSVNSTKTDSQKKTAVTDMNTAFGTYKTKLADYQIAYQDAIDAIAKKKADDAVDDVVIGGRNIFRQSGHWEKLPDTKYWRNNGGAIDLDTTVKYLGYNTIRTTVGKGISGYFDDWIELDINKIYTYSAMILSSGNIAGNATMPLHYHCSNNKVDNSFDVNTIKYQQVVTSNKWTLLYLTFKPNRKYWRSFIYIGSGSTIFNIAYLKLEEGTKATDWTPAPEDTDEKITEVSATLTSTISDVKSVVDKNTKSITDKVWKTDILTGIKDLNVGGINLWDLSAIKRYASGSLSALTGATIDAKAGKITVSANSEGVPGCKIDTSTLTRNTSNIGELVITGYYDRPDSDSNKFENVFLYYKCFNSSNAEVQAHTKLSLPVETSSKLFATTISIPANTAYINFGVGQFPYVKPYTLTGITVKDSALYDITKGLRDQVSQAYQDISGFKQTVSDTYTTKTEFDQLSIGGRNLFTKSNLNKYSNLEQWTINGYATGTLDSVNKYNGYTSIKLVTTNATGMNSKKITLLKGKTYTWSFYIKATEAFIPSFNKLLHMQLSDGSNIHCEVNRRFSPSNVLANTWTKVSATFDTPMTAETYTWSGYIWYLTNNQTYNVCCFKLEEGNKATDYTEAPEDTDEKFTNYTTTTDMNSLINQTKSNIELGVSKAYTSKTEGDKITQGLNKWILEVYQLTSSSMPNPRVADIENIRGKVPTKIIEVADTAMSASLNTGDYYIGHAFTYLYFDAAYTWSGTIKTDDEGVVYLNGVKKVSTTTSVATNISLPFQAGWNVLEVVYNEGTSNDGWLFSSKLSTLSQCKIMNCYAQVSLNASALIKVTADAINSKVENNSAYSEVVQNAGKMAWLIKSGTSAASMQLTPEALKIIAKNIDLTGLVTFNSLDDDAKKKIADAEKAGTDAQSSVETLKALDEILIVDVNSDTYFPYDSNLCTTSGQNPSGKAFLIEQGKFGKSMSVMDKVVNLWNRKGGSQSVGWSIITDTPEEYVIRYDFKSTQAMAYSANTLFTGDHLHKYTFSCWMYVSNDCNETTAPVISGESNTSFSNRYDMSRKGTWQFLSSTITPTTTTSSDGTVTCTIYFLLYPHQGTSPQVGGGYVLYRNPQAVQCAYPSNFYWGEKSSDEISYDISCPDIFTMSSYKKNICDPEWYNHVLTKNGNTFTYYINGSATDIYKNKWARYKCQKTASAITSNDIATMINPSERVYQLDAITGLVSHSWNATHIGYMFRSFIYCSEDVTITRNMNADNYGAAYCNGNRIGTATYNSNTPMPFNLNKGWNCVEICYSDSDTGGSLTLSGATFYSNSSVLYMTAEIPIEFLENKIHFLPRANSYYDEMFLSSRLLTAEQIKLIYETSKRFNDPSPVLSVTDPYDISFTIT